MKIQVAPDDLRMILDILKANFLVEFAFVFGSRVRGDHQPYSDLDILIKAAHPLTIQQLASLDSAFTSSDLPFKVDIVDWHMISDDFKAKITAGMIPIASALPK